MGYNRFYLSLVLYCILLLASAYLFFLFLTVRDQPTTAAGIALFSLIIIFRLIYLVNRSNRILASFLIHLQEEDPTLSHTIRYVDRNFEGLHESMELLIHEFKENRINSEVQAHYLETILNNVSTGIISFNDKGEIRTMNRAAAQLLGTGIQEHIRDLDQFHSKLGSTLFSLPSGEDLTLSHHMGNTERRLTFHCTQIKQKNESYHILALNDITHQMEEQEIRSWKKLIRVINHEIMNSMTPIVTLAMAIRKKVTRRSSEDLEDALQSASIIQERSNSLLDFIARYKKLTSLPPPKPESFQVHILFSQIQKLYSEELQDKGIKLDICENCGLELEADRQMMEQVLINLVKNAAEAFTSTSDAEIRLACVVKDEKLLITVTDNGEGIAPEKLEQVFVPFFSTREEGSGIGLSLCRQIIRLHGGSIRLDSEPGKGTVVSILL